jgi:ComF family protein
VARAWQTHLAGLARQGLDLLFPPACVGCGHLGARFCDVCAQAVTPVPTPLCAHCGRPQPAATAACPQCRRLRDDPLDWLRAAALHTVPLREAVHALKYEQQPDLAPLLARYLVAVYQAADWPRLPHALDAVVPTPLHRVRLTERSYNQADLLARHFCAATGLPLAADWLTRTRATRQQVGLSPGERLVNVDGAFAASPAVAGRALLVIDDVCTTGATLRACAAAARQAGAIAVYGLTLTQPVRRAPGSRPPGSRPDEPPPDEPPPDEPWWEGDV